MNKYTLEICVDSVESAINAQKGGATRLELCSNLIIGGTTPTKSLFEEVRKNVNIPINVLIRPRFGDFLYSKYEIEIIKNEIRMFREMGADGIVVGILTKEGEIDLENMKSFISEAQNIPVTFHRAFDVCKNPIKAFHELKKAGIKAILTSHQAFLTNEALDNIAEATFNNILSYVKEETLQNEVWYDEENDKIVEGVRVQK